MASDGSLKIFRVFGIDIELHWLFILLILAILLFYGISAAIILILLFVCVLLHELAHSVTAQRNKIKVSRIILLPIGGVSIIDTANIDPRIEFNITIAGPISSILIGLVFGVLVLFSPMGLLTRFLQIFFLLNIGLGVLNLIPAFPLDGGRVFRSYLQRKRNFYDATALTVTVGKYTMAIMAIASIAYIVIAPATLLLNLFDLFIVAFLYSGLQAEKRSVQIKHETLGLKLKDAISRKYILVARDTMISSLYGLVKKNKNHTIITRLDSGYAFLNIFNVSIPAKAHIASDIAVLLPVVSENEKVFDALSKIENSGTSVAAVVKGKRLIGIVTLQSLQALMSLHMLSRRREKRI